MMRRATLPILIMLLLAASWPAAEPLLMYRARGHMQAETMAGERGTWRLGRTLQDLTMPMQGAF